MKFKFFDEMILTLSNYKITKIEFKTRPQQMVDWLNIHLTVFGIVLFSFLSVLLIELANQNKIVLEDALKRNKCAVYARLEVLCLCGGTYLLSMSSHYGKKGAELLC